MTDVSTLLISLLGGVLLILSFLAGVWTGIILKTRSREVVKDVRVERIEVPTVQYIQGTPVAPPPPTRPAATTFVMNPGSPAQRRERREDEQIGELLADLPVDPEFAE